jgi:WD40 repeat protein/DNA-binding SARP family transcriptional activator
MAHTAFASEETEPGQSAARIHLGLLGPLEIRRDGQPVGLSGPKRRALLTLLAANLDTPVGREEIIEALWPRRPTGREESTLRVHVSHLRDVLEFERDHEPKVLLTRGQAYLLSGHVVDVDIRRFDELVSRARANLEGEPAVALELFDEALSLWRGRALQDTEYEEFAQDEVRRLDLARAAAIQDRAEALITVGEDGAAVQDLEPLARSDPTNERVAGLLMRALYRTGRQSDALRVARRLARHLGEQGLEVSPSTRLLEEQILNHDPGLLPEGTVVIDQLKPGRSVRGYELRDEAGRGSFGVVFRAFQPAVGREVALKAVDSELAQRPEFVRRFTEEARVIARLEHPHIVPLHDFWREPNGAFLVMRWMDGGSLVDRTGPRWETNELGRVFDQIADALGYAHSCGVVHRDVKPANVLFDATGNAYLSDFGLAVTGIETGAATTRPPRTVEPPYASPEQIRGEGPTVASDIYALGVMLAEAASGEAFADSSTSLPEAVWEVVTVATAAHPGDRFPDMSAFRLALSEAVGDQPAPAPRLVRRNPYKGLEPFEEIDTADFYGRDDVVESLLEGVAEGGLVAVVGASGSGKSSLVRAGLIPQLRDGAIPGSDEWSIVTMIPGSDPFDEFHLALRDTAVGVESGVGGGTSELQDAFLAALDGPNGRALLVIDQFEELYAPDLDEEIRERFLDNLVDLATDPARRVRVVITLRGDFADRPLSHPALGELMAGSTLLLAPMRPEQVERVIRGPAARVGVQVEPGLISEIIRDVADATAYLPLLQYVLSELFERRSEDRLTVGAYRSLGGVRGVLERTAEQVFSSLDDGAKATCRQLFLRMVHLGEHGEETRRRLALTELPGLGNRADGDAVLDAFSRARLLIYDRDPVSRAPTIEVAHEAVIHQWTRYRVWIDETRSELLAQRRISTAAQAWEESGEDPDYLLTGGPLATALDTAQSRLIDLNEPETRFVEESRSAADHAAEREAARLQHEVELEQRSRRRLVVGVATAVVALVVAVLGIFAWEQRQRAAELAETQSRENLSRELAAASLSHLNSADHDLSPLLAIAAAEETLGIGGEILPEAVDALHRAVVNPRPELVIEGAMGVTGAISYSGDGQALAYVTGDGEIAIVDPVTAAENVRIASLESPASGVEFHPESNLVLSTHRDGVREWDIETGEMVRWIPHAGRIRSVAYSRDGELIAIGDGSGTITVYSRADEPIELTDGHQGRIMSVDFDPLGARLVSGGFDGRVLVWDLVSGGVILEPELRTVLCVFDAVWHPIEDRIAITLCHGESLLVDADSGERLQTFASANQFHKALAFDSSGAGLLAAGTDGFTYLFNSEVGGASPVSLPNGGVPVEDVAFSPHHPPYQITTVEVATLGLDGVIRIWRDPFARSELPHRWTALLYPSIEATRDGTRYLVGSSSHILGLPQDPEVLPPVVHVVDAGSGEILTTQEPYSSFGWRWMMAISDDGSMVAFAGPSGNVVLLDVDEGVAEEIPNSQRWGVELAFSSDGQLLAGTGFDGYVAVWDVASRSQVRVMIPGLKVLPAGQSLLPDNAPFRLKFRPDSREVVTASADGSVRVWDTTNGTNRILRVFEFGLWSMDISPDGSSVVVVDRSGTVMLLDIDTGEELLPRPQSVSSQVGIRFSPDGRYLAGGGGSTPLVYLWDLETGEVIRQFEGAVGPPRVAFVNGGDELLAVGAEGMVRGYTLDPLRLLDIARGVVDREMTEGECERYLRRPCDG